MEWRVAFILAALSLLIGYCSGEQETTSYPYYEQYTGDYEGYEMTIEDLKRGLGRAVHTMVDRKIKKSEFCPRGTVFCTYTHRCVRTNCKERDYEYYWYQYGGSSVEDIRNDLRSTVQNLFHYESREKSSICPASMVFCMTTHSCVPTGCTRTKENFGDCPEPAGDVSMCTSQMECFSDSEGCQGNDKCCPNACSGTSCVAPKINIPDPGEDGVVLQPYRVVAYVAKLDPEPILMVGGQGLFDKKDHPATLKFHIGTASAGCVWKKVTGEETQLDSKGAEKTVRIWAAIADGEVLDIETSISCIPVSMSFHGLGKVNVTDDAKMNHTLAAIILPANVAPTISLNVLANATLTLLEDVTVSDVSLPVNISSPMSLTPAKFSIEDLIGLQSEKGEEIYDDYKERLADMRADQGSLGIYAQLRNVRKKVGTLSLKNADANANVGNRWEAISLRDGAYGSTVLKYEPEEDYSGEFLLVLFAWSGAWPVRSKDISIENVTLTVKVLNVNDAPRLSEFTMNALDFSPRSVWTEMAVPTDPDENEGMLVSEIVGLFFEDPEEGSLGICVLRAESIELGVYKYKPEGSDVWIPVDVTNPSASYASGSMTGFSRKRIASLYGLDDFEDVLDQTRDSTLPIYGGEFLHDCRLIKSTSRVRFEPHSDLGDTFWAYNSDTKWDIMAWDETVEGTEGELMPVSLPFCKSCALASSVLSYAFISGDAMRLGCDGKVSPVAMLFDVCGECSGDGTKCVDCNGDKDGVAFINVCGECVGGNSGVDNLETGRDCKGGCTEGEYMVADKMDGVCVPVGTDIDAMIGDVYCDGVWRSGAKIDDCGECSGTVSKERNFAKDECGVCHGDGSSCLDCGGEANGVKEVDSCGKCLSPDDAGFNTGCVSLGSFEPTYAVPGVEGYLTIYGAGLTSDHVISSCSLTFASDITVNLIVEDYKFAGNNDVVHVRYDSIDTGSYKVKCNVSTVSSGVVLNLAVDGQTLEVINPVVTSLSPSGAVIGSIPSKVVMTGTGFVDTGDCYCFSTCPVKVSRDCRSPESFAVFEAKVVDSTTVNCIVPTSFRKTFSFGVTLQLSFAISDPRYAEPTEISLYTMHDFVFTAPAPVILSATFVGACKVWIIFDMTIAEVASCDEALHTDSVAKFGADPLCFVRGGTLVVSLGTDSTLAAGDSLTLKDNAIRQRNSDSDSFASGSVTVEASDVNSVKFESFNAPSMIGNCDAFKLKAKFQGAGCSTLVYNWTVTLVGDSTDADVLQNVVDVTSFLSTVNTGLVELTEQHIKEGHAYEFSVSVITHLGEVSPVKTAVVERSASVQPLMIDLGRDRNDWDADKSLTIKAKVTKSECTSFTLSGVQYLWSSPTADFNLDDFNSVEVKIKGGTLKGGKTYTISIMAIVEDDPSITATASVTVTTASKALVPKIKGAPLKVVGVGRSYELDASKSVDPDRSDGDDTFYAWNCEKLVYDDDLVETSQPCEIPEMLDDGSVQFVQFEESLLTADETQSIITIPANTLDSNSNYRFGLLMAKGQRSATAELNVQVKEGSPPQVNIVPLAGKHEFGKDLYISASVSSPLAFSASWSSVSGEGYEELAYSAFGDDSEYDVASAKVDFPVTLVIHADEFKAGGKYNLQLSAEHKDSTAEATIEVEVNAPPTCASLEVSPLTGTALSQEFDMQLTGCDDDQDDFPLSYRFYRVSADSVRPLGSGPQTDSEMSTVLAKGIFRISAKVCDRHGSCAMFTFANNVTVENLDLSTESLDDFLLQIDEQRNLEGDSDMASAIVEHILSDENASDELKQAGLDIAKDEAKNALSKANPQADPEGSVDTLSSAVDKLSQAKGVVIGGVEQANVDEGTSQQFMNKSTDTVNALVVSSIDSTGARRRRKRAAPEGSSVNSIDIETAESMMLVQVTALEGTAEGDIEKSSAAAFFDTLELVWQGVCAGIVSGQTAQVGTTSLLTFRAYTTPFDTLANNSLPLSCESCAEVDTPANFTLGSHVVSKYGVWNCTDTDTCYGGCLATGQLNYDILTASSDSIEPYLSTRLSDIIAIHVINPSTYEFMGISNTSSPIEFNVELTSTPQVNAYEYMCRGWDGVLNDWSDSFCLPTVLDNSTGSWIAKCSCFSTGYFGVFEGAEIIDPGLLASTEAYAIFEPTTTPTNYLNGLEDSGVVSVYVSFRIDADAALLDADYAGVKADVLLWLTTTMNVTSSRITNLVLTSGSIKVAFDLLPGSSGQTDLNSAIGNLEDEVLAGASVTIGGVAYDCIVEPLVIDAKAKFTDIGATDSIGKAENGMKLGLIIGVVVGCCLLVILIVVVVAVMMVKKNNANNKIRNSPRGSEAQLPVVDNYELQKTAVSPQEEALYGPAPVPYRPDSVGKGTASVVPIGSRPSSTKGEMTPVGTAAQY